MTGKEKGILIAISAVFAIGVTSAAIGYFDVIKSNVKADNSSWMSEIPDETPLNDLLIPGSHDSGARYSIAELSGRCQDLEILPQLKAGIRFLDIRLQLNDNSLKVIHGIVDQKLTFQSVTESISTFLAENPTETILVSIKEEKAAASSSITFEEALKHQIDDNWLTSTSLPSSIGEARGKAILISRYSSSTIGVPAYDGWLDPSDATKNNSFTLGELYVQDHYKLKDADSKKDEIVSTLEHSLDSDLLHLNFLSGYLTSSFPPTYAPSIAKEINPWITSALEENENYKGVLIADYVTSDFASLVIERNAL